MKPIALGRRAAAVPPAPGGEPASVMVLVAAIQAIVYPVLLAMHVWAFSGATLWLALLDLSCAAVGVVAAIRLHRRSGEVPVNQVAFGSLLPVLNCGLAIDLTNDLRLTSVLMLAVVATGAIVRRATAMLGILGIAVVLWCIAASRQPATLGWSAGVGRYAGELSLGLAVAVMLHVIRRQSDAALRTTERSLAGRNDLVRASELRFRTLFEGSPVGTALLDDDQRFVEVNAAACLMLGRTGAEIVGRAGHDFLHPGDQAGLDWTAARTSGAKLDIRFLRPDGEVRWAWLSAGCAPGPAGTTQTLALIQDVTEHRAVEQAQRESEANLLSVARIIHQISSGADARQLVVDAGAELAHASVAALIEPSAGRDDQLQITAANDPSLVGTVISLLSPSVTASVFATGEEVFVGDTETNPLISAALRSLSDARSMYWVPIQGKGSMIGLLSVSWLDPIPTLDDQRVQGVKLLASEAGVALQQASLVQQLELLATTDPLTGALNRRGWDDQLRYTMASAQRTGDPLTVAIADLDHFKLFNDTYGHQTGDLLLQDFVIAARSTLRVVDAFARWGGEEFAIGLPDCPDYEAQTVLDRLRVAVPRGQTCSIGYATWDGQESADDLMRRADTALYAAKHNGRNNTRNAVAA